MWSKLPDKVTATFKHDPAIVCYRGSHSHGTFVPSNDPISTDDIDIFSIEVPPLDHYFGLGNWKGDDYWVDEYDIVEYPLAKYINLLAQGNPNCCMTLWLRDEDYFHISDLGQELIGERELFVGKARIYDAFLGYALGQFKKMTSFQKYEGYMGARRKALVNQFGYDVKNAAHVIRLLSTLLDFLITGDFFVNRKGHNADTLVAIKHGEWDKEQVRLYADTLINQCRCVYDDCQRPPYVDRETISDFITKLLREHYQLF